MRGIRLKFVVVVLVLSAACSAFAGRQENKELFSAIQQEDVAAVQRALDNGASPKALSFRGTALMVARRGGNQEIITLLEAASGGGDQEANAASDEASASASEEPARAAASEVQPADPDVAEAPSAKAEPEEAKAAATAAPVKAAAPQAPAAPAPQPAVIQPPASVEVVAQAKTVVQSGELTKRYNPIVVDYLVNEGQERLPAEVKKAALDQLVAALMAKTQISKEEQLTMALGTLTGVAMGAAGNDVISDAGGTVESSYASEWSDWIDSAFNLIHAGYSEEAATFFEFGMVYIPYPGLQARCVKGMALARPDQAYDFLMGKLEESNDPALKAVALPLLGLLASDDNVSDAQKDAIFEVLKANTGMMAGPEGQRAAMIGLRNMNEPRAAEVMKEFTSGMTTDKWVKRAAIRGLLFTYNDQDMVPLLDKMANAGSFSMTDDADKVWAGLMLIEAQTPEGYAWAAKKLPPPKRSFFAPKDTGPDPRADIVRYLVKYGGAKGHQVLAEAIEAYDDDDWMKTWIATGLLEFRDTRYIGLVKASLSNPEWDFTAVRIVEALAKNNDYSGLPVLEQLIQKTPPKKSGAMKFMNAVAGKADDTKAKERRLANLRIDIADALARINVDNGVPLLKMMLNDKNIYVRSAAALALTEMTRPAALDGLIAAMQVDYGLDDGRPRTPNVQSHVVRLAAMRFPDDPRTAQIKKLGQQAPYAGVQFLGTIEQ
jgi:hypothetical protein